MAKRFFTADWHLGSPAIIDYCKRPFKDVNHMNKLLIHNANMRAKKTDTIISVGDMISYGCSKGIEGLRVKYQDYVSQINATFINVEGNHDPNNKVKSICNFMLTNIGHYNVSIAHYPTNQLKFNIPTLPNHIHLCGHVHTNWKHKTINNILNINVGCDQWNYNPVSDSEIIRYIQKIS